MPMIRMLRVGSRERSSLTSTNPLVPGKRISISARV
jgi:hypothetical protein